MANPNVEVEVCIYFITIDQITYNIMKVTSDGLGGA